MARTGEQRAARLDDRYGRTPAVQRRRWLAGFAAVGIALGVGFSAWVGLSVGARPLRYQDLGYHVVDASATEVTFAVTFVRGPGAPAAVCTLRALNAGHAEVGLKDVRVESTAATVTLTARVPTSEQAVTGLVKGCAVAP